MPPGLPGRATRLPWRRPGVPERPCHDTLPRPGLASTSSATGTTTSRGGRGVGPGSASSVGPAMRSGARLYATPPGTDHHPTGARGRLLARRATRALAPRPSASTSPDGPRRFRPTWAPTLRRPRRAGRPPLGRVPRAGPRPARRCRGHEADPESAPTPLGAGLSRHTVAEAPRRARPGRTWVPAPRPTAADGWASDATAAVSRRAPRPSRGASTGRLLQALRHRQVRRGHGLPSGAETCGPGPDRRRPRNLLKICCSSAAACWCDGAGRDDAVAVAGWTLGNRCSSWSPTAAVSPAVSTPARRGQQAASPWARRRVLRPPHPRRAPPPPGTAVGQRPDGRAEHASGRGRAPPARRCLQPTRVQGGHVVAFEGTRPTASCRPGPP